MNNLSAHKIIQQHIQAVTMVDYYRAVHKPLPKRNSKGVHQIRSAAQTLAVKANGTLGTKKTDRFQIGRIVVFVVK